jgi:hypothetical protein
VHAVVFVRAVVRGCRLLAARGSGMAVIGHGKKLRFEANFGPRSALGAFAGGSNRR